MRACLDQYMWFGLVWCKGADTTPTSPRVIVSTVSKRECPFSREYNTRARRRLCLGVAYSLFGRDLTLARQFRFVSSRVVAVRVTSLFYRSQ